MRKFILLEACTGDEVTPDEAAELQDLEYSDGSPKYTICKEGGKYYAKKNLSPEEKKKKEEEKKKKEEEKKKKEQENKDKNKPDDDADNENNDANQSPDIDRNQTPDRRNDIPAYLECWSWDNNNLFDDNFSGKESEKAKEFKTWLFTYQPKGNKSYPFRVFATDYQAKYDGFCSPSTKEYENDGELHKAPFIREMALWETVNPQGDRIAIFDMWFELTQKNVKTQIEATTDNIKVNQTQINQNKAPETNKNMSDKKPSKNFSSAQEMFSKIKDTERYVIDADVKSKVDSFESLYRLSNSTVVNADDRKSSKACSTLINQYINVAKTRVDKAFGNPVIEKTNRALYNEVALYWYEFLETLAAIKSKIFSCREKGYTTPEISLSLRNAVAVVDSPWPVQLEDEDSEFNTLQNFMDTITVESKIKRKLEQKLEEKLIKESIRKKLILKSNMVENKVNKISENLYKIAGEFYSGNSQKFIKKLDKLTESYKNSKMYLTEDTNDSFSIAFARVFKGDEESIKAQSISYFLDKLGLEGAIRASVKEELEKIPSDEVTKMFTDDWSDIVVNAIVRNAESEESNPENVMGAIQKVMTNSIELSSEIQNKLKKEISKILTPVRDEKKDKIQAMSNRIKKSIIDLES